MRHPQGALPKRSRRLSLSLGAALIAVVGTTSVVAVASASTAKQSATIKVKNGFATSGTISASVPVRCRLNPRASRLGT